MHLTNRVKDVPKEQRPLHDLAAALLGQEVVLLGDRNGRALVVRVVLDEKGTLLGAEENHAPMAHDIGRNVR